MSTRYKIGVIGTGYVGLVSGACFADLGIKTTCLDVVEDKVNKINKGIPPIYEKGLDDLLNSVVVDRNLLQATLDRKKTLDESDIIFICLPTPSDKDGSINLKYVKEEIKELAKLYKNMDSYKTFVIKSTVIPGTTETTVKDLIEEYSGKKAGIDFGLAMNPEFLMEGLAIENFTKPDRVVIGAYDEKSYNMVAELYSSFSCPILKTSLTEAEMIKYASNSFLALKVSYINEIANICERVNADVGVVAKGMGLDSRISSKFLRAGIGFGGSCFGKDVSALLSLSRDIKRESKLLAALLDVNETQPLRVIEMLSEVLPDLNNKKIALLGLAFKPGTDDMRDSRAIVIANKLTELGAIVKGYDPVAKETAERVLPNINHEKSAIDALTDADACILATEWDEFRKLSADDFSVMAGKVIIDGRRALDWKKLRENGFTVKVIGQP